MEKEHLAELKKDTKEVLNASSLVQSDNFKIQKSIQLNGKKCIDTSFSVSIH